MKQKTIAVIGGDSAGSTAARIAHDGGAKVLFFMGDNADRASLCINAGCMPSKAMFEPIDAMHHARRHGWLSVEPRQPDEFLAEIVRWKDREIARFRAYRQAEIRGLADDRFEIVRANARFVNAHELESRGNRYPFDAAIIASGSAVRVPNIEGLNPSWDGVWTNDEILSNTRIPESLAVIGAGAVFVAN
jgi:pyruvate/2-oxoglutarate dehydrogenase complex dihydrolipoamide dehydrogenase (E3) component